MPVINKRNSLGRHGSYSHDTLARHARLLNYQLVFYVNTLQSKCFVQDPSPYGFNGLDRMLRMAGYRISYWQNSQNHP